MRTIKPSSQYKRDFKREKKGRHAKDLDADLEAVLTKLAQDEPLEERYRDHALLGVWKSKNHRECHVRPDLLLIYRKPENTLELARLGSHSELFKI